MQIDVIDLQFQGAPEVIAAFLVRGPGGPLLIETGPSSTRPALLAGLAALGVSPEEIRDVLVTHIHLDHAGAAGWWAQQGARVHVHGKGAAHLIDPSKLVSSATRIYGARMDTLWGDVPAAPADRIHVVTDRMKLAVGGLEVICHDTPGHAWHHLVFQIGDVLFTGDAAGIQLPGSRWVDLPAPPPEFDLEAWRATLARLRETGARTLYRTHFGPGEDAAAELDRFEAILERSARFVRELLDSGHDRDAMIEPFIEQMRGMASEAGMDPSLLEAYELANPRVMSVVGISRYWGKQRPA